MGTDPSPGDAADARAGGSRVQAALARRVKEIVLSAEREAATIQRDLDAHRQAVESEAQRYLEDARRQADALVQRRVHRLRALSDALVEQAEVARRQFDALIAALERETARLSAEDPGLPPMAPLPRDRRRPSGPAAAGEPAAAASPRSGAAGAAASPPPRPPPDPPPALRAAIRTPEDLRSAAEPQRRSAGGTGSRTARERAAAHGQTWRPVVAEPGESLAAHQPGPAADRGRAAAQPVSEPGADLAAARMVAIEMAVAGRTRDEVDYHLRDSFRIIDTAELLDEVFGSAGEQETRPSWVDR